MQVEIRCYKAVKLKLQFHFHEVPKELEKKKKKKFTENDYKRKGCTWVCNHLATCNDRMPW